MSSEVRKGDYSLVTDGATTRVYRNGPLLGHFWDDPQSGGYAAFPSRHCEADSPTEANAAVFSS